MASCIESHNVEQVCYVSLYSVIPMNKNAPRTSLERLEQSTTDFMVCASIDKELVEKEYIFDGKQMKKIEYVACVMKNGIESRLKVSSINLLPIKRAFEKKKL